ncbi:MAG: coiled-coil domain-containing protein [Dehalococcoidia bacterium]
MTLTESDIDRLIEIVRDDPHVRDRLRTAIIGDDFLALPGLVRQLVEHGHEVDGRIDRLTERMDQLAARMDQLTERMDQLAARMDQLTERVDQLAARIDQLAGDVRRLDGRVGGMAGDIYEEKFVRRLPARLGRRYRKVRVLSPADVEALEGAWRSGRLTDGQWDDAMLIDATAWAIPRDDASHGEVLVALEVSKVIDESDVERAHRRAGIFVAAGVPSVPVVGGQTILDEAERLAGTLGVVTIVAADAA